MYDPFDILQRLDDNTVPILIGFGLAMVLQNIAMGTAILVTRREGWISIPLPCTYLWFAHDLGVVARFDIWFKVYHHWFLELFWLGLLSALLLELVFFWQAFKVGRKEYLPNGTQAQWIALVVAGAIAVVVCWEYLETVFADPIYQAVPSITMFLLPVATTALILRRRSVIGQVPLIYACFGAMVVLWWGVTAGYYGEPFRSWQYITSGVVALVMYIALTIAIARMRRAGTPVPNLPQIPAGSSADEACADRVQRSAGR
ncbi:hypothetical protein ACFXG4_45200 [Nocardia sp. NPDC059246]|uniref:hypothetical protein n=1 Tax=unclassified Nocardia TaxID=2637762 RepID=UPI0036981BB2